MSCDDPEITAIITDDTIANNHLYLYLLFTVIPASNILKHHVSPFSNTHIQINARSINMTHHWSLSEVVH